jgi:hypothetical protein
MPAHSVDAGGAAGASAMAHGIRFFAEAIAIKSVQIDTLSTKAKI